MASLRRRRQVAAAEDYDDHDDGSRSSGGGGTAADSATEDYDEEEEEEDGHRHLGLHSMTAKGIQHLCSELLEINKASEQDFRANIYLSYLSFLRQHVLRLLMFQEAGDLEKDVHHLLKRHVVAHRRLVQHLNDNLCSSSMLLIGAMAQSRSGGTHKDFIDAATPIPDAVEAGHNFELELELDVLLSEQRMDAALQLLELQGQALQQMATTQMSGRPDDDDEGEAVAIASSICALSAAKARVADRLASVAANPRTPRAELLRAFSGLCRLGDARRANHLLLRFYRSLVVRRVEELHLRCSSSSSATPPSSSSQQDHHHHQIQSSGGGGGGSYIMELARIVFAAVLQASRGFAALHGHPSPYTADLVRWAREEMEDFAAVFSEYVKSVSRVEVGRSLVMAVEAAMCALSYSSLLRPLGVGADQHLMDLIVPCMQEVLAMYGKHLKEVIRLFVASDTWVLGRFLVTGILRATSPAGLQHIQYCLLTTSGRKFVTLIQEVVEDVYPLLNLGMKNSVLQLLAELFREYMHSIVELIARKEAAFENGSRETSNKDEQYMWQISILINCTTLVSLFPIIARGIFRNNHVSDGAALPNPVADFSAQRELDSLILLIKEAAGQVWTCFCQQFIRDTMSKSGASLLGVGILSSSSQQDMMPSTAFQVLFRRVRQLNNLYGSILTGKDGTMKKLLQELMEAMIFWLTNNLDSWIHHPRDTLFQQIQLDVHFLLEFAQLGGFSSESIRTSALDLLRKAEERVASLEHGSMMSSSIREEGWATDAAKHAVEVLMAAEAISRSSTHEEGSVQNAMDAAELDDVAGIGEEEGEEMDHRSDDHDCSSASSDHKDMVEDTCCVSVVEASEDHENRACDGFKSSDEFISIEDEEGSTEDDDMSSEKPKLGFPDSSAGIGGEDQEAVVISEHPELAVPEYTGAHGKDQGATGGDHESGLGGGTCSDAIEVEAAPSPSPSPQEEEVAGDDGDESSCSFGASSEGELVLQTKPMEVLGGRSRRRRQGSSTRPAEKGTPSRKTREAGRRSSRPRWQ
ncbi:hypothetical protein ACP70R_015946 [Stipagrostis hirtigluma subsp. patula]